MKNILIVDDDKVVRVTLSEWFTQFVQEVNPIIAEDGQHAVEILAGQKVDLVITDLNMPRMDGFELLAHINNNYPTLPTMVMTAFGTDQIKDKVNELGVLQFLEKPLNYDTLKQIDFLSLGGAPQPTTSAKSSAGESKNFVNGISLTSFLQLIDMEKKTCTLTITSGANKGLIYLFNGDLLDAETDTLTGDAAAYEIICWDNVLIEIDNQCIKREKNINFSTMHLLMEACRIKDERAEEQAESMVQHEVVPSSSSTSQTFVGQAGMEEFAEIDGFSAALLVTPNGETIQVLESPNNVLDLHQAGVLSNDILVSAKKAVQNFSATKTKFVHVEADNYHILGMCFNECENALNTEPGKEHIHLFLILTNGNSVGMAKNVMQKVITALAARLKV